MDLYLDTSTPDCVVKLTVGGEVYEYHAELGRDMAEKLHAHLNELFSQHGKSWQDLKSITYYSGPGSFTGLRIGASVVNALADQLQIPLYNHHGVRVPLIVPDYGRPANVSTPKK